MNLVEVKTADLIGPALDWAVGYAVRSNHSELNPWPGSREAWVIDWSRQSSYSPSTDWAHGGPLIDAQGIAIVGGERFNNDRLRIAYTADGVAAYGPTNLVAACRAIVSDKLGKLVSVPAELVSV